LLLHIGLLALSGSYGIAYMGRGLRYVCDRIGVKRDFTIFQLWMLIYAFVGVQMSWVLRPFLGDPGKPFSLFRKIEGNFFIVVFETIQHLLN